MTIYSYTIVILEKNLAFIEDQSKKDLLARLTFLYLHGF